jgi:hypothetical protein
MRFLILISLLVFSIICSAEIYMTTDKNGNILYSDAPAKGAEKIILPDAALPTPATIAPTIPTMNTAEKTPKTPSETSQNVPYTKFIIGVPTDKETITNQPTIPVVFLIDPDLQKGDTIQLYLDGTPIKSPEAKTSFELTNIERGTHQLSAALLDSNSNTIKETQTITIYIHYAHLGTPAN